MNTLPPPEKVQQLVRICSQSIVGQTAKGFVVEVLIDPAALTAGGLFDNAVRAAHMVIGWLGNHAEVIIALPPAAIETDRHHRPGQKRCSDRGPPAALRC